MKEMTDRRRPVTKMATKKHRLIGIVGPTAVGKTAVAIQIARALGTVILSADSRQFYREMSIGTAKPTPLELKEAPHYFIDSHHITANLSAGDYEREALNLLDSLFLSHPQIVLVGGSGLFVQALQHGLDDLPQVAASIREKWNRCFAEKGITYLQEALAKADPVYYEEVDRNNPQRLIRALEVHEATGQAFSSFRKKKTSSRKFETLLIGLDMDRETLYERINHRVDQMMADGLLAEVQRLWAHRELPTLKTVGYAELFEHLDGQITLEEAVEKIKQNTRRYAKRQLTWFRKDPEIRWFHPHDIEQIITYIRSDSPSA